MFNKILIVFKNRIINFLIVSWVFCYLQLNTLPINKDNKDLSYFLKGDPTSTQPISATPDFLHCGFLGSPEYKPI